MSSGPLLHVPQSEDDREARKASLETASIIAGVGALACGLGAFMAEDEDTRRGLRVGGLVLTGTSLVLDVTRKLTT
jgi:hypothetical protein